MISGYFSGVLGGLVTVAGSSGFLGGGRGQRPVSKLRMWTYRIGHLSRLVLFQAGKSYAWLYLEKYQAPLPFLLQ